MKIKIKIGHARGSEHRSCDDDKCKYPGTTCDAKYGTAGDQTGNEVSTNVRSDGSISTYNFEPTVLLRPKSNVLALKSAKICELACENSNVGYSQRGRNTLYSEAKKVNFDISKIAACNTDCSAFMTFCAVAAGATFGYGLDNKTNAPTCSSMKRWFTRKGEYQAETSSKYLGSTDYLKRGDILIGKGHTIMVLGYGEKIPQEERQEDYTDTSGISVINIKATVSNIGTTKASIKVKLTKVENNKETALPKNKLISYNWSYELTPLTNKSSSNYTEALPKISDLISLSNLEPNSSYLIKITAKEKNGTVILNSPDTLLTTAAKQKVDKSKIIEFKEVNSYHPICKLFLKVANVFKHIILYNTQERH